MGTVTGCQPVARRTANKITTAVVIIHHLGSPGSSGKRRFARCAGGAGRRGGRGGGRRVGGGGSSGGGELPRPAYPQCTLRPPVVSLAALSALTSLLRSVIAGRSGELGDRMEDVRTLHTDATIVDSRLPIAGDLSPGCNIYDGLQCHKVDTRNTLVRLGFLQEVAQSCRARLMNACDDGAARGDRVLRVAECLCCRGARDLSLPLCY
jgi:hypothetical protein